MGYARMPIEVESPEEYGYSRICNNLSASSICDRKLSDFGVTVPDLTLLYNDHRGAPALRELIVSEEESLHADRAAARGARNLRRSRAVVRAV